MVLAPLIAKVAATVVAATAAAPGAPVQAGAHCSVAPLSKSELRDGDAASRRFRALQTRERAPDLMGFRYGPRLPPPSPRERRRVRELSHERRFFGLNPSHLLVRRLMRDHSPRSRTSLLVGIQVTRIEERDLLFRTRIEDALGKVDRYGKRCAPDTWADVYLDYTPWPARYRVVALFNGPLAAHRRALARRYRFRGLMDFRSVRYSLRELFAVQRDIDRDWDGWKARGFEINNTGIDPERNVVVVGMEHPTRAARAPARIAWQSSASLAGWFGRSGRWSRFRCCSRWRRPR